MGAETANSPLPFDREGYASVLEVAEYLSFSTGAIYDLIGEGILPSARLGSRKGIRIPRAAVVALLQRELTQGSGTCQGREGAGGKGPSTSEKTASGSPQFREVEVQAVSVADSSPTAKRSKKLSKAS